MSTKYPQGVITPTPPFKSTTAQNFSGVWTLEQLAKNYFYYTQAVPNSLRFRSSASAYLSRTPATGSNRTTWTWSAWVKRGDVSGSTRQFVFSQGIDGNTFTEIEFTQSTNTITVQSYSSAASQIALITSATYRDPSAWYHIVLAVDTTQNASTDRVKLYVNGVQVTAFSTATYPAQNYATFVNSTNTASLGRLTGFASGFFDGYMAEVNFIDGQALDASYFGQRSPITGVWSPAKYVGSYGTNGFYLKFTDTTSTTTLCYDYSGNSNNWTPNNISLTAGSTYDSMLDSPTSYDNGGNGVGNYCVGNPLQTQAGGSFSDGNLTVSIANGATYSRLFGTTGVSSGKWYWEFTQNANAATMCGIAGSFRPATASGTLGYYSDEYAYYGTGQKYNNGSLTAYGASYTTNDVIGVALDLDAGTLTFYKNNVSQGTAYSSIPAGTYFPALGSASGTSTGWWNFGQRPFAYTPPSGFKALNTQNLSQPTIANGANYMAATLYTGTGVDPLVISGVGFQPDMVWIKSRSNALSHNIYDAVRGVSKRLQPNLTNAESSPISGVKSFNTNGFTLGNDTDDTNFTSGNTYVAWQWKAGGTAVTNTAGSITSQVSANTTAGFSVVTYTGNGTGGATVGHGGLVNLANGMIIVKRRDSAVNWFVGHGSQGWTKVFEGLNTTNAISTTSAAWNNTSPTSTVFTLGTETSMNGNGGTFVAYCFAAIPGYSAFGSYTGNGSADGVFIYLGFRPRYIMFKLTSTTGDWQVWDSSRDPYNVVGNLLNPNLSSAEQTGQYSLDFLSNGVKFRSGTIGNNSGQTYIYAAFAENPFKYSLAR